MCRGIYLSSKVCSPPGAKIGVCKKCLTTNEPINELHGGIKRRNHLDEMK